MCEFQVPYRATKEPIMTFHQEPNAFLLQKKKINHRFLFTFNIYLKISIYIKKKFNYVNYVHYVKIPDQ